MKKTLLVLCVLLRMQTLSAQDNFKKPFFTGDINFTFGLNENYVLFEPDDGEELLEFSALMVRLGVGYQFNKRWLASFNFGYDHHSRFGISAIPTYGALRYNISVDGLDTFFVESGYGRMWRPSNRYKDGNYYKLGVGTQIAGEGRWNVVLKLDFHRKKIAGFKHGNLDSISLGVGFSFF